MHPNLSTKATGIFHEPPTTELFLGLTSLMAQWSQIRYNGAIWCIDKNDRRKFQPFAYFEIEKKPRKDIPSGRITTRNGIVDYWTQGTRVRVLVDGQEIGAWKWKRRFFNCQVDIHPKSGNQWSVTIPRFRNTSGQQSCRLVSSNSIIVECSISTFVRAEFVQSFVRLPTWIPESSIFPKLVMDYFAPMATEMTTPGAFFDFHSKGKAPLFLNNTIAELSPEEQLVLLAFSLWARILW